MKNQLQFYERDQIEIIHGKSMHSIPLHSHECFCIGGVLEGEVTFSIGGKSETLRAGRGFLIPGNVGVIMTAETSYTYFTVCLKGMWKDFFNQFQYSGYFFSATGESILWEECLEYMNGLESEEFKKRIWNKINSCFTVTKIKKENLLTEEIREARQYILECAGEKFDLEALAGRVHMSKYHFVRVFKSQLGVTPHQYYIQAKLRIVKDEMNNNVSATVKTSEGSVNLATKLCFSDQSHLCNLFKKQMGISMRDYQKNYLRENKEETCK